MGVDWTVLSNVKTKASLLQTNTIADWTVSNKIDAEVCVNANPNQTETKSKSWFTYFSLFINYL